MVLPEKSQTSWALPWYIHTPKFSKILTSSRFLTSYMTYNRSGSLSKFRFSLNYLKRSQPVKPSAHFRFLSDLRLPWRHFRSTSTPASGWPTIGGTSSGPDSIRRTTLEQGNIAFDSNVLLDYHIWLQRFARISYLVVTICKVIVFNS